MFDRRSGAGQSSYEAQLATALRKATLEAEVPGVDKIKLVTVVVDSYQIVGLPDNDTLVIIVEGLFDRPERTGDIRQRFADMLADAAAALFCEWGMQGWQIEVLVKRWPERDPYVSRYAVGPDPDDPEPQPSESTSDN